MAPAQASEDQGGNDTIQNEPSTKGQPDSPVATHEPFPDDKKDEVSSSSKATSTADCGEIKAETNEDEMAVVYI